MPKIKKEKKSSSSSPQSSSSSVGKGNGNGSGQRYPIGTLLAVDLYGHGNFFEAVIQNTTDLKIDGVVRVQYFDKDETVGTIDLNQTHTVELVEDNILTLEDCADRDVSENEKGFLGRRLTVQWEDNQRYSGTITKTLKDQKNFVFITYDDGDMVWYDLAPEKKKEEGSGAVAAASAAASASANRRQSSNHHQNPRSASRSTSSSDLEKKYPIGCTIAVDSYHDEHYHEAVVRKYIPNPSKAQQTKGEQWVYLHWLDQEKTKNWVDLNCIKAIKVIDEEILRLDQVKSGQNKGFLGKRIVVQWKDGNKYCGLATKCSRDNKHFVFLEYDDGDQCWCDLQRESYWSIDGEGYDDDSSDELGDDGSDHDVGRPGTQGKRKRTSQGNPGKRSRSSEVSNDF
eukprot:jgi/Psemu1/215131/e_gw1.725.3.1